MTENTTTRPIASASTTINDSGNLLTLGYLEHSKLQSDFEKNIRGQRFYGCLLDHHLLSCRWVQPWKLMDSIRVGSGVALRSLRQCMFSLFCPLLKSSTLCESVHYVSTKYLLEFLQNLFYTCLALNNKVIEFHFHTQVYVCIKTPTKTGILTDIKFVF